MTHAELIDAFARQERATVAYWDAFDTATFFRRSGTSWSPADTVRHLTKSTRPVAKALAMPKLVLRVMFGASRRASMSYDDLVARYRNALAEGGQAGRFAPSQHEEADEEQWRASIMNEYRRTNAALQNPIASWRDEQLDRLQLPHPLLGKLTVREMLMFTLYHHRHHIAVIDARYGAASSSPPA